jgi:hypothetical protein
MLNVAVFPLKEIVDFTQPSDKLTLLVSLEVTFLLKVKVTFIFPGVVVSGDIKVSVTVGFEVSTVNESALEAEDVCEFRFWVAVSDQMPLAKVPNVQLAVPPEGADEVVQETLLEPTLAAVTVTVAPSVTPVKSSVGVLSAVLLSAVFEPVSELEFRSGAEPRPARPVIAVAVDAVAAVVPPTLLAVTTARINLPTSPAATA